MLVAHVEREGVWTLDKGMSGLAEALAALAQRRGATFVFEQEASRILVERGRATGVETRGGAHFPAEAVVFNGDVIRARRGAAWSQPRRAPRLRRRPARARSRR